MFEKIQESMHIRMNKCIENFKKNINSIRTNRVTPALLNNIYVDYFGIKTSLKQLSNIVVENNKNLKLTVFDSSMKKPIEKAILSSNLGLNPFSTDSCICIPIPALTEEKRKEIIKIIRVDAEKAKINIRNIRRETNDKLKTFLKDGDISKDIVQSIKITIQKNTDIFIKKIDDFIAIKEHHLLQI